LSESRSYWHFLLIGIAGVAIAVSGFLVLPDSLLKIQESPDPPESTQISANYLDDFKGGAGSVQWLERKIQGETKLLVMGSSELSHQNDAHIPNRFLNECSPNSCIAFGKAGFQCAAMLQVLAATGAREKGAEYCIILSPGWFEGKSAKGTDPAAMLDFFVPALESLYESLMKNPSLGRFWYRNSGQFSRSDALMQYLSLNFASSQSLIHKTIYYPLLKLLELYIHYFYEKAEVPFIQRQDFQTPGTPNTDSLFQMALHQHLASVKSNTLGIEDEYYRNYLGSKPHRRLRMPLFNENSEYHDFCDLIKFIKENKLRVSFVMLPLHPEVYTNLEVLNPVMHDIQRMLEQNEFPYLNLMPGGPHYTTGILSDIMHLSDAGWVKVDEFILKEHYESR
jgi:poly-D-alanine transfer protein DltD